MSEAGMRWTHADVDAINELTWPTNAAAALSTRISALKWGFDLVKAQGEDDELADALDDMLTECKHMARRRTERTWEGIDRDAAKREWVLRK